MFAALRFCWLAARGHRLRPWRSPYLSWRIETYSGRKAESIGFLSFLQFAWQERSALRRFLGWADQMERYRRHSRSPARS